MPYYLVQRLESKPGNEGNGFDRYFSLDYMGSSEFEWGAIPKALASVRSQKVVTRNFPITIDGTTRAVYFVGHKKNLPICADAMKLWIEGNERRPPFWGKERTHFKENFIGATEDYYKRTDAWWAIREDVAWALDPAVAAKLEAGFNSKPAR